jgi:hypothetical protein
VAAAQRLSEPVRINASRSLVNIALLVLVAIAGAFLYFKPQPPQPSTVPLLATPLEAVQRIEIERSSGMRIVLARENGQWRMQAPVAGRLDEVALARVLNIARAQSGEPIPAADLGRFELDAPWARVRFDGHEIAFGMTNEVTGELYVRSGEHVHVVPARLAAAVPGDASKLLAHRLFAPDEKLAAVRLAGFSVRYDDGRWRLEPGGQDESQDDLLRWVDHWRLATSLITQPQTDAGSQRAIEVDLRDGRRLTLHVTALAPDLVLRRDDERLEYHFPSRLAGVLLAPPRGLDEAKP